MPVTLLKSCPNAMDQEEMYYKEKKILFFLTATFFFIGAHVPTLHQKCAKSNFFL